jgi:archaellum biogenesis protein FlaJ (TadC family)
MEKRHRDEQKPDRYLKLRNLLNLVFMLGAIVGVCIYIWGNSTVGIIIILVAMAFKMAECVFRFMK